VMRIPLPELEDENAKLRATIINLLLRSTP
jgi:hypothetical protein